MKDYIAVNNDTYKLTNVEKLVPDAFASISINRWKDSVKSARKKEDFYWETDGLRYSEVEPVVIRVNDDSDDDNTSIDDSSDFDSETDKE